MNYFAHALPHLGRPVFMAGTALPDWLSVVDRRLRLRPRMLEPHLSTESMDGAMNPVRELAAGTLQHLQDDDWFHRTRGFAEVTAQVGQRFREYLQGTDGFRCGFLGHIVSEMLLDSVLIELYPQEFARYYRELATVNPEMVAVAVESFAGRPADRLDWFIGLYQREQILKDYREMPRFLRRLNQVLGRVKLSPLPEQAATWLLEIRAIVFERRYDLLPQGHYPWPEQSCPTDEFP